MKSSAGNVRGNAYDGDSTRERLLRGAADAIGKLGYASARVEDILDAAGVSRPTFYKFFASKEAVFQELSRGHHREIRRRIVQASRGAPSPIEQLRAIAEAFLRWRAELGPIGRVLDLEARTPGSSTAHHRTKTLRAMTKLARDSLRAAKRPPVDPVLLYALVSVLESVADQLLAKPPITESTLARAGANALRILAGALAMPGDPLPDLPAPPEGSRPKSAA